MRARRTLERGAKRLRVPLLVGVTLFALLILGYKLGVQPLITAILGAAILAGVFVKPRVLTTVSPLFIPLFYLGVWRVQEGLILIFIAAVVGGLFARTSPSSIYVVVPVVLGIYLTLRELTDPTGEIGPYSHFSMTALGIAALAAAIVAPPDLESFLLLTAVSGLVFSIVALTSGVLTENNRAEAVLGINANGIALMAAAGMVAGATLVILGRSKPQRIVAGVAGALCVVGLVLGQSQGAFLGLAAGALALGWAWNRKSVLPLAVGVAAVAFLVFSTGLADSLGGATRPETDLEASRFVRAQVLDRAWELFLSQPWLGVGRGNAAVYIYSSAFGDPGTPAPIVPHNVYLQILTMAGITGLAVCTIGVAILLIGRGLWRDRKLVGPLLAAFGVFGFTNEWHIYTVVLIPAVALGAWAAHPKTRQSEELTPPTTSGAFPPERSRHVAEPVTGTGTS